jgi:hypothetical protein
MNTRRLVDLTPVEAIEIISSKKTCRPDTVPREIKYELSLEDGYDFVFVDGPSLTVDGIKWKDAVNSNVLELPQRPEVIVADGRRATARHLAQKLSNQYHVNLSDIFSDAPVKHNYNFFPTLSRRADRQHPEGYLNQNLLFSLEIDKWEVLSKYESVEINATDSRGTAGPRAGSQAAVGLRGGAAWISVSNRTPSGDALSYPFFS